MDSALWISWYNLPDDGRDSYLAWLHQTYIPAMLERRGFLWAAHYASVARTGIVPTHPEFVTPRPTHKRP